MDDVFRKLSAGTRFTRKDLRIDKKQGAKKVAIKGEMARPETNLPDELNFFKIKTTDTQVNQESASDTNIPKSAKIPSKPIFKSETDMHVFRKKKGIKVYGEDVPSPVRKFIDLSRPTYGIPVELVLTVLKRGITRPTPVQMQGTPVLMVGRDAFIIAPTGSGKTLVFIMALIGELMSSNHSNDKTQTIVITPTRELALQIKDEFRKFTPPSKKNPSKPAVGSVLLNKAVLNSWQMIPPKRFPEIIVATPKRLVQAIETKTIDLSMVKRIVLDEADKLLEFGMIGQIDDILSACTYSGGPIRKALLSATISTGVEGLARTFMNEDPIKIVIGTPNAATKTIEQELIYVGQEEGKLMAIRQLLIQGIEPPVIIFAETIERATALFHNLVKHGVIVEMIHGDRTQAERERIISQFRAGRIWFLITTELLARGLDFPEVSCVINYDFPLTTASYIHRIGRTGRAGKKGKAITLYTRDDIDALRIVANVMKQSGYDIPDWMLQLKRKSTKALLKKRKWKCISMD